MYQPEFIKHTLHSDDYIIPTEYSSNSSFIYGEVDCIELANIMKDLGLPDRLYLDIGSGFGKVVIYLALKLNIMIDGVELIKTRYDKSIDLYNQYNVQNNVYLYNCDFTHLYLGNYDVIYCCNLVFSKQDNDILYNKMIREFIGYAILFNYNHILKPFLKYTKHIKTSWNKSQTIYIFDIH